MKTIKAMAVALALVGSMAYARGASLVVDNPENRTYLGARVALDISSAANGGAYYSNKPGFSLGAVYHIPVVANLYFEPGLSMFYNVFGTMYYATETILLPEVNDAGESTQDVVYQIDGSVRNFGFRVPLHVGYHFDFAENMRVSVFTGPQFNASLLARYHQNRYVTPSGKVEEGTSGSVFGTGGFKHFDAQWNFGVGLDYGNYMVALSGSLGMTRLRDAYGPFQKNMRRNLFSITLGYNF